MRRRGILLRGLGLVLRHPGAVVWTYGFNLTIAVVFSLSLHARLASVLDHSMAAEGLNAQFDLGTVGAVAHQLGYRTPPSGGAAYLGLPIYFLVYFVLIPGALFGMRVGAPGRLKNLTTQGLGFFWRFFRILLLTLVVSAPVLGALSAAIGVWSAWVIEHEVGGAQLWFRLPAWAALALVAAGLRLYFDLVEVYAVQLDDHYRLDGKPDRRVRKVLIPAAKTLWRNFGRAYWIFVGLAVLGVCEVLVTAHAALHMLAQPRVWPAFLLLQAGLFLSLLTRYWQRGVETVLAADFPLPVTARPPVEDEGVASFETFSYGEVRPQPVEPVEPLVFPARNEVAGDEQG